MKSEEKITMKDIPTWEGLYKATTDGRIYSVRRHKFLTPIINNIGYHQVRLFFKDRREQLEVSHLIYTTFKGPIPKGYHCHHLNGRKECNNIQNLMLINGREHIRMHSLGNQYSKGIKRSEQTKKKVSDALKASWKRRKQNEMHSVDQLNDIIEETFNGPIIIYQQQK